MKKSIRNKGITLVITIIRRIKKLIKDFKKNFNWSRKAIKKGRKRKRMGFWNVIKVHN